MAQAVATEVRARPRTFRFHSDGESTPQSAHIRRRAPRPRSLDYTYRGAPCACTGVR